MKLLQIVFLCTIATMTSVYAVCVRRSYGSSFVCVCNSTYCDTAPNIGVLTPGEAMLISSNRIESRFQTSKLLFDNPLPRQSVFSFRRIFNILKTGFLQTYWKMGILLKVPWQIVSEFWSNQTRRKVTELRIDASVKYQSIIGFGGAFTDATGINIAKLSLPSQDLLMRSYFGTDGIEYNIGRVPMAGCDFSTRAYSYADFPGDVTLSNFSLTTEDFNYKIPYINAAKNLSSKTLRLFSSPWSAPPWIKSNNAFYGKSYLLPEYYQVWANYFIKFFEGYSKSGIEFWGVTAQNEPLTGKLPGYVFNSMGWNAQQQAVFVGNHLGPTLQSNGFGNIKIMILDDNRIFLPGWVETVLEQAEANNFVSGIAVHWYKDAFSSPKSLTMTHDKFPDRFILSTEACAGFSPFGPAVILGNWRRLEEYAEDIIENLNHWVTGWVDWNMVLDDVGGPNWAGFSCDSPIIVNITSDEFYKQPMYYAIGHFSKYIPEDSIRIDLKFAKVDPDIVGTAFLRPDGKRAIVILNKSEDDITIAINDLDRGRINFTCSARSLNTLIYN